MEDAKPKRVPVSFTVPLGLKLLAVRACIDEDRHLSALFIDAMYDYLVKQGYLEPGAPLPDSEEQMRAILSPPRAGGH